MNDELKRAVDTLWDYMRCDQPVDDAEVLLVIGSLNDDVAKYAAKVEAQHAYDHVVVSGGDSRYEKTSALGWKERTEAEHFATVMKGAGCQRKDILLEMKAAHTGENAANTYDLLENHNLLPCKSLLVVTKPYFERRVLATFDIQWPDKTTRIQVTSPPGDFEEYCKGKDLQVWTIHVMVGDLQRIMEYPALGFQSAQQVPEKVITAWKWLIAEGYTDHLMK